MDNKFFEINDRGKIMATIGILGGNPNETTIILSRMCQEKGQKPLVGYYKITENNSIPIVSIDENACGSPKVFILQEATNFNLYLRYDDYLVVNIDSHIALPLTTGGNIITYGFNGKASVTASSVTDDALQICIQRGFKSLSGCPYEPQELKAACPANFNPLNVLGAATAAMIVS